MNPWIQSKILVCSCAKFDGIYSILTTQLSFVLNSMKKCTTWSFSFLSLFVWFWHIKDHQSSPEPAGFSYRQCVECRCELLHIWNVKWICFLRNKVPLTGVACANISAIFTEMFHQRWATALLPLKGLDQGRNQGYETSEVQTKKVWALIYE